jgi:hyperosmotically inducible protein
MRKSVAALLKGIFSVMVVLVFVIGVSGCQKQEGPIEEAGKKADKAVEATKGAVEEAGKKIEEGAEATKEAVEKAGEKVGEGAEKAKETVKKGVESTAGAVKETAAKSRRKSKKINLLFFLPEWSGLCLDHSGSSLNVSWGRSPDDDLLNPDSKSFLPDALKPVPDFPVQGRRPEPYPDGRRPCRRPQGQSPE